MLVQQQVKIIEKIDDLCKSQKDKEVNKKKKIKLAVNLQLFATILYSTLPLILILGIFFLVAFFAPAAFPLFGVIAVFGLPLLIFTLGCFPKAGRSRS